MERTYQDFKQWSPLHRQIYYERNPKNEKEIRTYRPHYNVFAGNTNLQISPWHVAEPTAEMKPWHPGISRALNLMQPTEYRGFY